MANNRELSQFASYVAVGDTSGEVTISKRVELPEGVGISSLSPAAGVSTVTVYQNLEVTGDIVYGNYGKLISDKVQVYNISASLSAADRGKELVGILSELSARNAVAYSEVIINLPAGITGVGETSAALFSYPGKLVIRGASTTGIRPGTIGNPTYNQIGVPNGGISTVGPWASFIDASTIGSGKAYPTVMANGRGPTSTVIGFTTSQFNNYYGTKVVGLSSQIDNIFLFDSCDNIRLERLSVYTSLDDFDVTNYSIDVDYNQTGIQSKNSTVYVKDCGFTNIGNAIGIVGSTLRLEEVNAVGVGRGYIAADNSAVGVSSCVFNNSGAFPFTVIRAAHTQMQTLPWIYTDVNGQRVRTVVPTHNFFNNSNGTGEIRTSSTVENESSGNRNYFCNNAGRGLYLFDDSSFGEYNANVVRIWANGSSGVEIDDSSTFSCNQGSIISLNGGVAVWCRRGSTARATGTAFTGNTHQAVICNWNSTVNIAGAATTYSGNGTSSAAPFANTQIVCLNNSTVNAYQAPVGLGLSPAINTVGNNGAQILNENSEVATTSSFYI